MRQCRLQYLEEYYINTKAANVFHARRSFAETRVNPSYTKCILSSTLVYTYNSNYRSLLRISNVLGYQQCGDVWFYAIQISTTKEGKMENLPASHSFHIRNRQSASIINIRCTYNHARALFIIWRSDWIAYSINIENENLKQ